MPHSEKDGQNIFHGVNDYYDVNPVKFANRPLFHRVNLKYARLAETGIGREAENWHAKVQSTKHLDYSIVHMNLEDREQMNLLCLNLTIAGVCNPDKTGDANSGGFELFEHPKRISFF